MRMDTEPNRKERIMESNEKLAWDYTYVDELNAIDSMSRKELASFAAKMLARHAVVSLDMETSEHGHWSDFHRLDKPEIRRILERADSLHRKILDREEYLEIERFDSELSPLN